MAESKKRGGGPKTPNGKANSSQNSTKHGCTSKVLFLPGENPEDFDAIEAGWRNEFEPDGYQEERLVEILVLNDWWLKRAQRNLDEAEAEVFGDGGDFHRVELMQRYKTTHERAFYRALNALQGLRKDIMRERMENVRLQGKLERFELEVARLKAQQKPEAPQAEVPAPRQKSQNATKPGKKNVRKIQTVEQWVEITVEDGVTKTQLFPPNEVLLKEAKEMEAPDLVYRRMNFVHGVPAEYAWAGGNAEIRARGGHGIQRMTYEKWLEVIEQERGSGTGHLGPCGGNLPRPKERGGCDCPVCTHNAAVLERMAG